MFIFMQIVLLLLLLLLFLRRTQRNFPKINAATLSIRVALILMQYFMFRTISVASIIMISICNALCLYVRSEVMIAMQLGQCLSIII